MSTEKKRAYGRAYYHANREKRNAYAREYGRTHREKRRQYNAARRAKSNDHARAYRDRHPDRASASSAAYKATHPDSRRARYAANPAKELTKNRAWLAAHPEKNAHYQATRRAQLVGNGGTHTLTEWREKCALFANLCAYCGEARRLYRDHKIPLSRGGSDDITNIVPSCGSCNSSKGARTAPEYLAARAVKFGTPPGQHASVARPLVYVLPREMTP